jgi:hypothetical protein
MSYGQYPRIVSYFEELFVAGGNLGTNLAHQTYVFGPDFLPLDLRQTGLDCSRNGSCFSISIPIVRITRRHPPLPAFP